MIIEYAKTRGFKFAFIFEGEEVDFICKGLQNQINVLERRLKEVENNPNNEGQATYAMRADYLRGSIKDLKQMIIDLK